MLKQDLKKKFNSYKRFAIFKQALNTTIFNCLHYKYSVKIAFYTKYFGFFYVNIVKSNV